MTRLKETVTAIFAGLLLAGGAHAQVSLDSVRIEAKDTVARRSFTGMRSACRRSIGSKFRGHGSLRELRRDGGSGQGQHESADDTFSSRFRRSEGPDDARDFPGEGHDIGRGGRQGRRWNDDGHPAAVREEGIVLGFAIDPAGNWIELIHRP